MAAAARSRRRPPARTPATAPKAANDPVYATGGYTGSAANASQISLATDNVFSDGASLELATVAGSVSSGLAASLTVAVQ